MESGGGKKMMKLRMVVIATWLMWINSIMCLSIDDEFSSSLLKTHVVDHKAAAVGVTPVFRIPGPNGYCAHADKNVDLRLYNCVTSTPVQNYTFDSTNGTLRTNGKCVAATSLTQGSYVVTSNCDTALTEFIVWTIQTHGAIVNRASGLALSAIFGNYWTKLTLEVNEFSSYQTWRTQDYNPPVNTAYVLASNDYCMQTSNNEVLLSQTCGNIGSGEKWLIYSDGTIRPEENSNECLSFDSSNDRRVLVTTCGLSPTSERWLYTANGTLFNERSNLVLEADSNFSKIFADPPTGIANQQWKILYT